MAQGHETTATTTTWLLYDLSQPHNRHIQDRLRAELLGVETETPTMEELAALPYLDAVIREGLRLVSCVVVGSLNGVKIADGPRSKNSVTDTLGRQAEKDDVIPVATPVMGKDGMELHEIR